MRLIDADKLGLTDLEIVMCAGDYREALKMILEKIEKAPTVFECTPVTEEEKKVRCIDCKHLRVELIKQRNLPDSICINPLWKELGRAPHVIGHDEHEPIRCDYFEKKEDKA